MYVVWLVESDEVRKVGTALAARTPVDGEGGGERERFRRIDSL